jgi:hypothetical protein
MSLPPGVETGAIPKRHGNLKAASKDRGEWGPSQASDDQLGVIKELCEHVDRVMTTLGSKSGKISRESSEVVQKLKSRMILFASAPENGPFLGRNPINKSHLRSSDESSEAGWSKSSGGSSSGRDARHSKTADRLPFVASSAKQLRSSHLALEERLLDALERLDSRTVPVPEPYDSATGYSFWAFLVGFEEYCQHRFMGDDKNWVGELSGLLVGEKQKALLAHRSPGESCSLIKTKMLCWYDESKQHREAGSRAMFSKATKAQGETIRLYAARLENSFRMAYPKKCVRSRQTLQDKFLGSIPHKFWKQIKSAMSLTRSVEKKPLSWSQIVT